MSRSFLPFILAIVFIFAAAFPAFADNSPGKERGERKHGPEITPFEVPMSKMDNMKIYIQRNEMPPMFMHKMGMAPCFSISPGMDSDREFLKSMIIHHRSAIDMCEYILRRGNDPVVKSWAEGIIATQQDEVNQMQQWLDEMSAKPYEKFRMPMHKDWGMPGPDWEMPLNPMKMMDETWEMRPHIKIRMYKMDGSFKSGAKGKMEHPMMKYQRMDAFRGKYSGDMKMLGEMSGMLRHLKEADNPDKAFVKIMLKHHSSAVETALKALQKAKDPRIMELALNIVKSESDEMFMFRNWLAGANTQPPEMHEGYL